MGYRKPKEGFDYNPLMKLDRNGKCICDSGQKYKKCCLPHMPAILPVATIEKLFIKKEPPCQQEVTGNTRNTPSDYTEVRTELKRKLEVVRSYLSERIKIKPSAPTP